MSIARASGEKWDGERANAKIWHEVEIEYLRHFPRRYKWFNVFLLHIELGWGVRKIAQAVSLSHGHCSRVLRRTQLDVARLKQKTLPAVARLRIAATDDDE